MSTSCYSKGYALSVLYRLVYKALVPAALVHCGISLSILKLNPPLSGSEGNTRLGNEKQACLDCKPF